MRGPQLSIDVCLRIVSGMQPAQARSFMEQQGFEEIGQPGSGRWHRLQPAEFFNRISREIREDIHVTEMDHTGKPIDAPTEAPAFVPPEQTKPPLQFNPPLRPGETPEMRQRMIEENWAKLSAAGQGREF